MRNRSIARRVRAAVLESLEGRRLMSAGSLDATFGAAGALPEQVLAIDAKGRLLEPGAVNASQIGPPAAGQVSTDPSAFSYTPTVTRLNPDGSVDTTFGTDGTAEVAGVGPYGSVGQILIEPGGKILVNAGSEQDRSTGTLTQLTAAGQVDTTFGTNGSIDYASGYYGNGGAIAVVGPDGKITSIGASTTVGDDTSAIVERFTAAGQPDPTFGTTGQVDLAAASAALGYAPVGDAEADEVGIALDASGRPLVTLDETRTATGASDLGLFRLTTAGKLDTTFGTGGLAVASIANNPDDDLVNPAVAPDGTIYAALEGGNAAGDTAGLVFAFAANGKSVAGGPVPTPSGTGDVDDLVVDSSGRPIITLNEVDSTAVNDDSLARLNPIPAGGLPTFDPTFAASGAVPLPFTFVDRGDLFLDAAGNVVVTGQGGTARVQTAGPSSVTPAVASGTVIGSAGSYKNLGNTTAKAFDGNLNTFYDAAHASGDWAGMDFGTAKTVDQIRFAPRSGYAARMVGGQFQVSSTADFSTDVHTVYTVIVAPASGVLTTVTLGPVPDYRYARYLGPANGECNVAEVQFLVAGLTEQVGTIVGTAGSYQSQGDTVAHAFDDNLNTFVDATASAGAFVGEQFATAVAVTQVRFAPRAGYESRMVGGVIQASTTADFADPVTVYTIRTAPVAGTLTTVAIPPTGAGFKFWRYLGPASGHDNIAELELDA